MSISKDPLGPAGPRTSPAGGPPAAARAPRPGAGLALLVDDHALVRTTTAEMLAALGFDVAEATSAEEAIRLVAGGLRPDVVVADYLLPGMTGADLARLLRDRCREAAFLLVSGHAGVGGVVPDFPCLTKPFRKAQLEAGIAAARDGGAPLPSAAGEAA